MEINKIKIYSDGKNDFIKVKDLYPIVLCGSNAFYKVYEEAKKDNFISLKDCMKEELHKLGISMLTLKSEEK